MNTTIRNTALVLFGAIALSTASHAASKIERLPTVVISAKAVKLERLPTVVVEGRRTPEVTRVAEAPLPARVATR